MEVIIHERDDISHVVLKGRLDATGVEEIDEQFTAVTVGRGLPAVIDISDISFMSSLGIGFLFANTKKLKKAGSKLVLLNPQGMVQGVLKISKMDKVMPVVYELDDALRLLLGEPAPAAATTPVVEVPLGFAEESEAEPAAATQLTLTVKNEVAALKDLYAKVNEFLDSHGTPYRSGYTVNLALEELVVNVMRYAYMDFDEHLIDIDLSLVDNQLILVIEDDGRPFDPREGNALNPHLEAPTDPDEVEVGGLGLILVLDMVDVLRYARVGEKNRTEVRILFGELDEAATAAALAD